MRKLILDIRASIFFAGYATAVFLLWPLSSSLKRLGASEQKTYQILIRFTHFIIWWLRVCCGVKHHIRGIENLPSEPCVIVCNHQSTWETFFFSTLLNPVSSVIKQELLEIRFFGPALGLVRPIAIDRSKPILAMRQLMKQGLDRLEQGMFILVFPEGTRVPIGEQEPFNPGAFMLAAKAGVPVIPVVHNAGHFWEHGRYHKTPGTIQMIVGGPVSIDREGAKEAAVQIEAWMRDTLAEIEVSFNNEP